MAHQQAIGSFPFPVVRLYCPDCHRFAQYRLVGLVERFGADLHCHALLTELKPCNKGNDTWSRCQLVYFDFMSPQSRRAALDKGGLPDAWEVSYQGFERVMRGR